MAITIIRVAKTAEGNMKCMATTNKPIQSPDFLLPGAMRPVDF